MFNSPQSSFHIYSVYSRLCGAFSVCLPPVPCFKISQLTSKALHTPHTRAHRGTHLPLFLMWIALRKPFKQQEVINWIRNLLGVIVRQIRTTILDFWVVANRTVNLQSICWILAQNLMIQSLYPLKVQGLWGNEYSGFSSIPKEPGVSIRMAAITITANCH